MVDTARSKASSATYASTPPDENAPPDVDLMQNISFVAAKQDSELTLINQQSRGEGGDQLSASAENVDSAKVAGKNIMTSKDKQLKRGASGRIGSAMSSLGKGIKKMFRGGNKNMTLPY